VLEDLAFELGGPDVPDAVSAFLGLCPNDPQIPLAIDTVTKLLVCIDAGSTCPRDGADPARFKAAVLARLSIKAH
jgi:hypothetical protein